MNYRRLLVLTIVLGWLMPAAAAAAPVASVQAGPCVAGGSYSSACDVDQNGVINILDIQLAAGHWNQSGPYTGGGWDLTGNAGTVAGTNFVGTTDNVALELRANGQRALRLEPGGDRPNVIGGSRANVVTTGVRSATIAGGGSDNLFNRVTDEYGTIGGGYGNTAGDNAGTVSDRAFATVGGGGGNTASGWRSTIGGGWYNVADGETSFVGGGQVNQSSGGLAAIGGGYSNLANGTYAVVAGGNDNQASGTAATVGGGGGNWASAYGVVAGGQDNTANPYGTVPGGRNNFASGDYSLAAGRRAKALFDGDFVWADSADADFGASAANQFLVRASGGVGLGTNAPGNQLHVAESLNLSATPPNHVAQIENTSTGNSGDVLALKIGYTGNPVESNNFITFFKGNDASVGSIEGNGGGGVVLAGPGNQIALWLPKLDPAEVMLPGDLIGVVDGMATKDTTAASHVLIVASSAMLAGADPGQDARAGYVLATVLGLAQVRVAGPVRAGDVILPSGRNDGLGMAAAPEALLSDQVSRIAGQVWSAEGAESTELVTVAVGFESANSTILRLLAEQHQQNDRIAELEARLAALEQASAARP
ncbi:MAG TPA: hypothetical protein VL334_07265 [Anaerolineae bacterium]|nr:hypothetical protein [Anaerolineae bacterium]